MSDLGLSSQETERRERQRRNTSIDYSRFARQPLRVSIREGRILLSCTRQHLYDLIRRGLIRTSGTRRKKWLCFEDLQRIARGELPERDEAAD